jgi:hypothetical protein
MSQETTETRADQLGATEKWQLPSRLATTPVITPPPRGNTKTTTTRTLSKQTAAPLEQKVNGSIRSIFQSPHSPRRMLVGLPSSSLPNEDDGNAPSFRGSTGTLGSTGSSVRSDADHARHKSEQRRAKTSSTSERRCSGKSERRRKSLRRSSNGNRVAPIQFDGTTSPPLKDGSTNKNDDNNKDDDGGFNLFSIARSSPPRRSSLQAPKLTAALQLRRQDSLTFIDNKKTSPMDRVGSYKKHRGEHRGKPLSP